MQFLLAFLQRDRVVGVIFKYGMTGTHADERGYMSNIKTIKVGTFNLMNFMLPDKSLYGGTLGLTRDEYRRKSEWTEFMLNQMDADIIGFQELFDREAMVRIIRNNPRYRKARLYMAEEGGDQPSVALLSRYPVENLEIFTHFPEEAVIDFNPKGREPVALPFTTFTRAVIKADIRIRDYGLITVFVVHLKSKRAIFDADEDPQNPVDLARAQSRSLMLRAAESVALRALVSHALEIPERPVVLCGDVNDTGNAVTSRIISGEVPQHKLSDSVKRRGWDLLLYHVKDIQARRSYQDFYYTHIHNGMYESLDQIMVSQELVTEYPRRTGRVGLVSVYNDHLVDQTFSNQGVDKCKSDHGVVVCTLELDLDRAARYMRDGGYGDPEELADPEAALNRLDEARDMSRAGHDVAAEAADGAEMIADQETADAGEDAQAFNVQNSLDKWRRNNPQGTRGRTDNRRRSFDSRNDRGYRKEERRPLQPESAYKHEDEEEPPMRPICPKPLNTADNAVNTKPVKSQEVVEVLSVPETVAEILEMGEPEKESELAGEAAHAPEKITDEAQQKTPRVRKLFRCKETKLDGSSEERPVRHEEKHTSNVDKMSEESAMPVVDVTDRSDEVARPVRERRHRKPIAEAVQKGDDAVQAAKPAEEAAKPAEEAAKPAEESAKPEEDKLAVVKLRRRRGSASKNASGDVGSSKASDAERANEAETASAAAKPGTDEVMANTIKIKRRRSTGEEMPEPVDVSGDDAQTPARVRTRVRRHRAPIGE